MASPKRKMKKLLSKINDQRKAHTQPKTAAEKPKNQLTVEGLNNDQLKQIRLTKGLEKAVATAVKEHENSQNSDVGFGIFGVLNSIGSLAHVTPVLSGRNDVDSTYKNLFIHKLKMKLTGSRVLDKAEVDKFEMDNNKVISLRKPDNSMEHTAQASAEVQPSSAATSPINPNMGDTSLDAQAAVTPLMEPEALKAPLPPEIADQNTDLDAMLVELIASLKELDEKVLPPPTEESQLYDNTGVDAVYEVLENELQQLSIESQVLSNTAADSGGAPQSSKAREMLASLEEKATPEQSHESRTKPK